VMASGGAHSSVTQSARAMDADVVAVPPDASGRLTGEALRATIDAMPPEDRDRLIAIVATSGTTNAGVIDDLAAVAEACAELGTWMHVDGAYGGAALAAPSVRHRFAGIEAADSFIVDPHKWLFAPFDSCALIYRDPEIARHAHIQHAEYLEILHGDGGAIEWNASDYAHHLTRRARGLPLWFSLATHGTDAYRDAIETALRVARQGAELVRAAPHLELLLEPELSVVLFRRRGWDAAQYKAWSDWQLRSGESFVTPTAWAGETVLRWCIVNPLTTIDDLALIVDSLAVDKVPGV
jgi:L-2,4-diaminobutyrate decarboxylase